MPASAVPPIVATDVPTWKSPNELIHERINFDDTIWGFGLAGGAYYKTPLRITYVKPGSRAQMAHIYPGDVVLRINGIESSTLTLEEAHQIILESGIHLKIAVTSPEDLEDNYYCYQDPLQSQIEEIQVKQIKHTAIPKFPKVLGKSSHWSLQWPWKCKRKIIYKESNCYLVPSKYEEKHKDTRKPEVKQDDMIILDSIHNAKGKKNVARKSSNKNNLIEQSRSTDKNEKDGATEQISPVDKNNEDATEQNSPVDTKNEDVVIEQNTSVQKKSEDVTAEEHTVDKSNEDEIVEQDSSADKSEEVTAEDNSSLNKNDEDIVAGQNISVLKTEGNNVSEQNNSVHKPGENTENNHSGDKNDNSDEKQNISEEKNESNVLEQNALENKNVADDITEQINLDRNDEQNSVEVIDSTVKDETDGDNAKFDDIPLMTDSEKLAHNSR